MAEPPSRERRDPPGPPIRAPLTHAALVCGRLYLNLAENGREMPDIPMPLEEDESAAPLQTLQDASCLVSAKSSEPGGASAGGDAEEVEAIGAPVNEE